MINDYEITLNCVTCLTYLVVTSAWLHSHVDAGAGI